MALALVFSESNGASPGTATDGVTALDYASIDIASAAGVSAANPIVAFTPSFEKYWRVKCVTPATNSLGNFTVFFSSTPVEDASTSSANVAVKFGIANAYAAPVGTASTVATALVSTNDTAPGVAFTGPANVAGAYSAQYIVTQFTSQGSAVGGDCIFPTPFISAQYLYS